MNIIGSSRARLSGTASYLARAVPTLGDQTGIIVIKFGFAQGVADTKDMLAAFIYQLLCLRSESFGRVAAYCETRSIWSVEALQVIPA